MTYINEIIKASLSKSIQTGDFSDLENIQPLINKVLDKPNNLVLLSDAYKYSHHKLYEDNTTEFYSYLESRGGLFETTVFYGLQIFLKQFLEGVAIIKDDIDEAEIVLNSKDGVFGRDDVFDRSKFDYIVDTHGGRLPIKIMAVPEGTIVETKNILMSIESTDPKCAWLVNFLETIMLQIWYPITVATLSREIKKIILKTYSITSDLSKSEIDVIIEYALNDFGLRGVSSVQSAQNGGSAHTINFFGSDNLAAQSCISKFYNTDLVYTKSIPATEHSIMTLRGEHGELEIMERVLDKYPTGTIACVSDSYNIIRAVNEYWGDELKDKILNRSGTLVIRPDSGDIIQTLIMIFNSLFDKFGFTINSKGFKVLPDQIRVIQGDGVNINSITEVCKMLIDRKISMENMCFGMGGKLLQAHIDRDTLNFAFKAAYVTVDGDKRNVAKSPIEINSDGSVTQSFKKSKSGRMKLVKTENGYVTLTSDDVEYDDAKDELINVFENGKILVQWNFDQIRSRVIINDIELEKIKNI